MVKTPKIKWLGVLFYLFLQIVALVSGRGLGQSNAETLFFPGRGLEGYREFLKNFEEQKLLLVKATFPSELDETLYENFRKTIENLREEYTDIEILTFFDIYRASLKQDDLKTIREFSQNKPDLQLKFVGPDSLVFLTVFDPQTPPERIRSFISRLQTQEFFSHLKLQMAGLPYINDLLDQYSRAINTQLFPILFLVVFLATLGFTRNLLTSLALFVPALGSLNLTLAFVKLFYSSMNMVTCIVPLLIFVLNLSLALHFFYAFLEFGSFRRALHEKKAPFLLMVSTTAIGFGSLAVSDIPAIRQFGILSFPAILISAALTFLWAYSVFPWRIQENAKDHLEWIPLRFFSRTWRLSTIAVLILVLTPASFLAFPKIPLNTDATSYFSKRSEIEKNIRALENEVLGVPILEIDLSKKDHSEFAYEDLLTLDQLESDLLQEFGGRRKILSANQLVKEANYLYTGEKKLPPFEISYWTLKSQAVPSVQRQYPKSSHYRLTLFGPTMDFKPYQGELNRVRKILDRFPQFQTVSSGAYYQIMRAQSSLIWILTVTFILRLLIIALLFYVYFRSLRLLVIFLLGNEVPVLACVLFLWICRYSLNVATVMVFPVSVGIVVGNTIHVIDALTKRKSPSFEEYFKTIVIPVLIGSLTLVLGFALLGFYGFVPIQQFGTALAFTVFLGMFSALYLVPTLVTKSSDLRRVLSGKETQT
jgi:uncharacterized protein